MKTSEIKQLQEKVAGKVVVRDDFDRDKINLIAGFDVAATGKDVVCSGVIINKDFEVVERVGKREE